MLSFYMYSMPFRAKVYIADVCALLCIMGHDMTGMQYYRKDDFK